jgi:hypothetical protein
MYLRVASVSSLSGCTVTTDLDMTSLTGTFLSAASWQNAEASIDNVAAHDIGNA